MPKVVIYLEGGGDCKEQRAKIRRGMTEFLRKGGAGLVQVVCCGATPFRDYRVAAQRPGSDHLLLLVDSEEPVSSSPSSVVLKRAGDALAQVDDDQCHLMVQCMESWIVADPDALKGYYGEALGKLPRRRNIEEEPKDQVLVSLNKATEGTSKGRYHKIQHASELLARLNPGTVRVRAPHCDRLFAYLDRLLTPS